MFTSVAHILCCYFSTNQIKFVQSINIIFMHLYKEKSPLFNIAFLHVYKENIFFQILYVNFLNFW